MKELYFAFVISLFLASSVFGGSGEGGSGLETPDGILFLEPATVNNCVAIRLDVPGDQMLSGIRWYNGSADEVFPYILVATGQDVFPPNTQEAIVAATGAGGQEGDWTTVEFGTPVASATGTLFVIFQYPVNYIPAEGEPTHGLGYTNQEDPVLYFVSGDGESWYKTARHLKLLVEPILVARDFSVVALSENHPEIIEEESSLPTLEMTLVAFPNPFNPEVKLELFLPEGSPVEVKIFDVRGRILRNLFTGGLEAGANMFRWDGRDEDGRRVSSGVYWAQVQTSDRQLSQRVVLVK